MRARQTWFRAQGRAGHPVLVAEFGGEMIGSTAYGNFRGSGTWPGHRFAVEHTIHMDARHWGKGVGRTLLVTLMGRARANDVHVMVRAIDGANAESSAFHRLLGFEIVARMPEVGSKFDDWLDLVLMQRIRQ